MEIGDTKRFYVIRRLESKDLFAGSPSDSPHLPEFTKDILDALRYRHAKQDDAEKVAEYVSRWEKERQRNDKLEIVEVQVTVRELNASVSKTVVGQVLK